MIDSCSPRKLEPGLAAQYSIPRDLITSTMKSEPGRSLGVTSAAEVALAAAAPPGCCAKATELCASSAAAPAVAPVKNPRRPTGFLLVLDMKLGPPTEDPSFYIWFNSGTQSGEPKSVGWQPSKRIRRW